MAKEAPRGARGSTGARKIAAPALAAGRKARLPGVDQRLDLCPEGLRVAGQHVQSLFTAQRAFSFPAGLPRGTLSFGLSLALVTGFGGGVQQLGHCAPGTAVIGCVGFTVESAL